MELYELTKRGCLMQKFRTKLFIIFGVLFLIVAIILVGLNTVFTINSNKHQMADYEKELMENYDQLIQFETEGTMSLLDYAYNQYQLGFLTEEEAKELGHALVKQVRYGDSGYFWIDHVDGTLIAHPEIPQNEGNNRMDIQDPNGTYLIRNIIEAATTGANDGFTEYMWEKPGVEGLVLKRAYSQLFEPWDYIVSTGNYIDDIEAKLVAKEAEFSAALQKQITLQILILIVLIIGYSIIAYIFSARIAGNIQRIGGFVQEMANRNLSIEPLDLKTKDEIGQLSRNVNQLAIDMHGIISKLRATAQSVYNQSYALSETSNQVRESSEQISVTMQNLATGSDSQAQYITDIAQTMQAFTETMRSSNQRGEEIRKATHNIVDLTTNGDKHMQASIEQMKKIDYVVAESLAKVENLDNQTREISVLVSVIKEIADQTNLLALNAAIEAARAGEQGKGFAVVADEVRQLAEQVSKSVSNITTIVSSIQHESSVVMEYLQEGYHEVSQGSTQILQTGESFNQINNSIGQMLESLNVMSESLQEMTEKSEAIQRSIEEVAAITEETSAGIEETTASIQLTSTNMHDIAKNADALEEISEELNKIVNEFKV